ncbi:hypothetical protein OHT52_16085 [Streptomyces sp. NBC_00247]|uniref:hypothetical protein n=1 Tax=Streptomyces sp. NBC_00247 TaxID=2975689 RepID=UPI002E2A8FDA|nr:hypothetical protein [Streptomyces sp. NBC_00247]
MHGVASWFSAENAPARSRRDEPQSEGARAHLPQQAQLLRELTSARAAVERDEASA